MGIDDLVKQHLNGAGRRDCDHWHDGAGIMTHHLGFTLRMELSLQAVDKSVTIPYWEYTKDAYFFGGSWRKSPIFQENWFGNAGVELGREHHMRQGRWGNLRVMENAEEFSNVTNMWGLLRSPWNLNAVPFVSRSDAVVGMSYLGGELPGCSTVKACFDSSSLSDMNTCLNGATHGPLHILIGGQWDVDLGELGEHLIGSAHLLLFKDLWRRGFARCPTSIADCVDKDSGSAEACAALTCEVPDELVEKVGGAYEVLSSHSGALHWMAATSNGVIRYDQTKGRFYLPGKTHEEEERIWKMLLEKLGNPGKVGEMYTSTAPYDPTFWIIHTTSERLLQYRRLRAGTGADASDVMSFDETFGYTHVDADSDLGVVCDWSGVKEGSLDLPSCVKGTCEGHNSDDVIPFDLHEISSALSKKTTNVEFYKWLDPLNDDIPYVYDNFKYDHCAEQGIYIGSVE